MRMAPIVRAAGSRGQPDDHLHWHIYDDHWRCQISALTSTTHHAIVAKEVNLHADDRVVGNSLTVMHRPAQQIPIDPRPRVIAPQWMTGHAYHDGLVRCQIAVRSTRSVCSKEVEHGPRDGIGLLR